MIKQLLSVALLAVSVSANAQNLQVRSNVVSEPVNASNFNLRLSGGNQVLNTIDTLMPASTILPSGCAVATPTNSLSGFVFYRIDRNAVKDSGFYFGTGIYPFAGAVTTDLAQKYPSGVAGLSVTNVLTWAAKAKGGTNTTTATIYDEDLSTKGPMTALGASTPIPMSAYTTTAYNNYIFPTPVAVAPNTNFFAGISIPTFGGTDADTMAIVTTKFGCSSPDSLSWMNINIAGWIPVKALFVGNPNLDIMIWPVVDIPTSGVVAYSKNELNLYAASPNPTSNTVNINFSLNTASKVNIDVVDISGKIVKSIKGTETFSSSTKHSVAIDVTNLEAGTYFYSINANNTKLFSKFVVAK